MSDEEITWSPVRGVGVVHPDPQQVQIDPKQYAQLLADIRQIVRDELQRHDRGPTGLGGVWGSQS